MLQKCPFLQSLLALCVKNVCVCVWCTGWIWGWCIPQLCLRWQEMGSEKCCFHGNRYVREGARRAFVFPGENIHTHTFTHIYMHSVRQQINIYVAGHVYKHCPHVGGAKGQLHRALWSCKAQIFREEGCLWASRAETRFSCQNPSLPCNADLMTTPKGTGDKLCGKPAALYNYITSLIRNFTQVN